MELKSRTVFYIGKLGKKKKRKKKRARGFENLWVGGVWANKPFFFLALRGLNIPSVTFVFLGVSSPADGVYVDLKMHTKESQTYFDLLHITATHGNVKCSISKASKSVIAVKIPFTTWFLLQLY